MIIVDPEIYVVDLSEGSHDFIILACDGIFDRLNTENTCQEIWGSVPSFMREQDIKGDNSPKNRKGPNREDSNSMPDAMFHQICGNGVDNLLIKAMKL